MTRARSQSRTHTSPRAGKPTVCGARGAGGEFIVIFDVLRIEFRAIIIGVPYHATPHRNDERRGAGNSNGVLASIRSKLMLTCITFCHCITNKPNQIPPILRIERDIATSGGAS